MITWKPPVITGGQVFYEVSCQKTCKDCDEKTCDGKAGLVSRKKSSDTNHATITALSPFVNYTCKIMAKNRVSEAAGSKHHVSANVTLTTQGSGKSLRLNSAWVLTSFLRVRILFHCDKFTENYEKKKRGFKEYGLFLSVYLLSYN